MKVYVVSLLFLLLSAFCLTSETSDRPGGMLNLMPVPAEVKRTSGKFRLDESFRMAVGGGAGKKVFSAATRVLHRLSGRTGLFFTQGLPFLDDEVESPGLLISTNRSGKVRLGEDESYSLAVTSTQIRISAETDLGALHGLETFLQLLSVDEEGYFFPGVEIVDFPRFPWRGLMIDAARHFMPIEVIKRNLDGMAAVKLNVFHWHLSDDQGFRVESKEHPKLHELGSDGLYYTQEQIREVVAYAEERGLRVVPEFDVPGHTTSLLVGYPELGSAPGPYRIERTWGIHDPALNPARKKTYQFLEKFFREMFKLFPDPYFHIGGDELEQGEYHKANHWNNNPEIQAFMKKKHIPDNAALQAYFNRRLARIVTEYGRRMVGWDEILHEQMPTHVIIQS